MGTTKPKTASSLSIALLMGLVSGSAGGLAGCGDEAGARGGQPGLGGVPDDDVEVTYLEEGDYGPIAQYLASNADTPLPEAPPADGEDDGGGDDGAGDDGGDDGGGEPGDGDIPCDGYACADGACIDSSWECDDIVDCDGGEDEAACGAGGDGGGDTPDSCDGFSCANGDCIDASWECDGEVDCNAGEDEASCGDDGGGACDGFSCADGLCIDAEWACDDIIDCDGGEDEAACGQQALSPIDAFAQLPEVQALSGSCLVTWTVAGAGAGAAAAEVATKACEGGGVAVGLVTGGTGFAVAGVCGAADIAFVDTVAGGVIGALSGLTGAVYYCDGGVRDQATALFAQIVGTETIPTYNVKSGATTKKCGVPLEVPLSGDADQCSDMHDEMKSFGSSNPHECSFDMGNLGNDPQVLAATCEDIKRRFQNASDVADKRLAIGDACYDNGNAGPMGSSDYGHQVAWCSVHRAMGNCVAQAKHPKMANAGCNLTQTMKNFDEPQGCNNVLSCN